MEKEMSPAEKKQAMREMFDRKIAFLMSKKGVHEEEVRDLLRSLFREWLGLNFEFTYEEAEAALETIYLHDDIKKKITGILHDMTLFEYYQEHEPTEGQLQQVVTGIKGMIPELLGSQKQEDEDVINRIFSTLGLQKRKTAKAKEAMDNAPAHLDGKAEPVPSEIQAASASMPNFQKAQGIAPLPAVEPAVRAPEAEARISAFISMQQPAGAGQGGVGRGNALVAEESSGIHERIYVKLEQLYEALANSRHDKARSIYNSILEIYHPLGSDEKSRYYDVLYQVYQRLSAK